jgi:PAT family beta-lactamase induction signal transducer AmpG
MNPPFPAATAADDDLAQALPHPVLFLVLMMPFGICAGFLTVALSYQLTRQGVSTGAVAGVIALSLVPHTWRFLWAPLVDTLWTRKRWYVAATLVCGFGFYLSGRFAGQPPVSLAMLSALLMISNIASTVLSMAVESLMASAIPDTLRGRTSGWFQAGNLGGQGLGGGFGLWLMQGAGWASGAAGAALGAICALCCLALFGLNDSRPVLRLGDRLAAPKDLGLVDNAKAIALDLWALVRSRVGALAVVICFLPIGSGAAQNLWSAVSNDWHASANTVALVNGALGGIVSALGCIVGGWICDRLDRRTAYCLFGGLLATCAAAMAVCPRTSAQFVLWTTVYAFILGLCYAGYSTIVLEAIGRTAAATKFSLLAALSNVPIAYLTLVDGLANDRWGTRGMLWTEASCGVAGIAVFAALAAATKRGGAPRASQAA